MEIISLLLTNHDISDILNIMKDLKKWLQKECNLTYSIKELNNITELDISYRSFTELHPDIGQLPKLRTLRCHVNSLTKLQLNHPKLERLFCFSNLISQLELNCPKLKLLHCDSNQLKNIKLSHKYIYELRCDNNNLDTLELNCPQLTYLDCNNNQLKNIKLYMPKLSELYSFGNDFKVIKNSDTHKLLERFKEKYSLIEDSKFSSII